MNKSRAAEMLDWALYKYSEDRIKFYVIHSVHL